MATPIAATPPKNSARAEKARFTAFPRPQKGGPESPPLFTSAGLFFAVDALGGCLGAGQDRVHGLLAGLLFDVVDNRLLHGLAERLLLVGRGDVDFHALLAERAE